MAVVSKHSRPDQWPSVRLAPLATDTSGTSGLASRPSKMDIGYVLNQEVTPESEHGSRFAGHPKVVGSPIAPSSQSSSPGATFGRTPLPDVRPPSSTGSMSSPDVPLSGLDHLAMAASMSKPSPEHLAQRGSSPVKAKKVTRTYIEEVLAQRGEPMTSREICKAIIADLKVELAPQSKKKKNTPTSCGHWQTHTPTRLCTLEATACASPIHTQAMPWTASAALTEFETGNERNRIDNFDNSDNAPKKSKPDDRY
ncbi:hypothetical protein V501_10244 [Pseudogymnoascus sp. VKM F-4519 (FW-2642)]|nr:hypothetical protein V501_10244 [Pseudogymnoascus sp. VKM F-4519 (FW-2642)]